MPAEGPVLRVQDLAVDYGPFRAVDGVSFELAEGECLGLAGESGSGKSTVAHAIARTLPAPAVIRRGRALLSGVDLFELSFEQMQHRRFKDVALVFQAAMNVLNPVLTVGEHFADTLRAHRPGTTARHATERARELLGRVGLPARCVDAYAHQLSGGMRQRAVLALALCLEPRLLILDEPTTALDVITQRSILEDLRRLVEELRVGVLFISHDLPLLFDFADRVLVMYAGRLAELGPSSELARAPRHPYTRALLDSIPTLDPSRRRVAIPGLPPSASAMPSGCRFHPRCAHASERCRRDVPLPEPPAAQSVAACHHPLA